MAFLRFALGALIAAALIVAALPAVVLVDLASGGTGLGLCPTGLGTCRTTPFAIAELVVVFAAILGVIGAGIAGCLRLLRRHDGGRSIRTE